MRSVNSRVALILNLNYRFVFVQGSNFIRILFIDHGILDVFFYSWLLFVTPVVLRAVLYFAGVKRERIEVVFVHVFMLPARSEWVNHLSAIHAKCNHAMVTSQMLASDQVVFPDHSVTTHTKLKALTGL